MSFNPPPLPPFQPTWPQFQVWWQQVLGSLQTELGALAAAQAAQADATAALANAAAAQTTATTASTAAATAQTTANTANTTANTVTRNDAIADSTMIPGEVLTASDAGSNAQIVIATHVVRYNDGTAPTVTGATLTGLSYATAYYVYYDQTSRAGGSVTYHATTDAKTALPAAAAGRHFCGKVTTPASGGTATTGGGNPPGGGGGVGGAEVF